jgi:fido (protein-threonine AMPylation protein)
MPFNPKFEWVQGLNQADTFTEVASKINKPHEDYPDRVNQTLGALDTLFEFDLISSFEARQIHSLIFPGQSWSGKWREVEVKIGNDNPPPHFMVPSLIKKIFPAIRLRDYETQKVNYLIEWYRKFQIIHPFENGNGRVGGVIVAVLSWNGEKMLAPLQ